MTINRKHGSVVIEYLKDGGTYIHYIKVDEDYRNRGYGSKMLRYALSKAKMPVYLYAGSELGGDVVRLKKWYRRFWFVEQRGCVNGYNYNMVLSEGR